MERCSTCVHWGPLDRFPRDGWDRAAPLGRCELADADMSEPVHPSSLAVADGNDGYQSWLKVRPDFGCVQWEA